ncbi:Endonuclease, Uma2 family (restriction endonuclease fold) [Thiothrix caldifontis]|uniref:Endonuclease, Uma2 family (Restriction endonuclease fold) n=1 Tax=Thiothrix caldifontis TaxID=525918 RepID=A0A1H3VMP3_9GAMM|nr:Uma2 family endonuclease [Thiothrix caldifontis]SDZ75514.1 Endonuclease, Uma2 family (restriction endonuclease fold) [Thiothrix caldifontis]
MAALAQQLGITPEDYLAGERDAPFRHEYVHGQAYAMAGAADGHVRVSGNAFAFLKNHLRGSGCSVYMADMKVRVKQDTAFFYPDVMVTCDPADLQRSHFKQSPILVIEVLSPSTEGYDRGGKFALYRELDSLQEYVLIDPRAYQVDVFRRNALGRWELFAAHGETATIEFASVGCECTMHDLYEDVNFALEAE